MTQLRDLTPDPEADKVRRERLERLVAWSTSDDGLDWDVLASGDTWAHRRERRPKPQRTWPRMVMGALAMYGLFSLVLHAVVAWEMTH